MTYLTNAAIIGAFPSADDQTIVEQLVTHGYERLKAELLLVFVPSGLARAVIARIPVARPIKLSGTAQIDDYVSNQTFRVRLAGVPEFETARQLGEEAFHTGIIPVSNSAQRAVSASSRSLLTRLSMKG